jgi:hypothetical protein
MTKRAPSDDLELLRPKRVCTPPVHCLGLLAEANIKELGILVMECLCDSTYKHGDTLFALAKTSVLWCSAWRESWKRIWPIVWRSSVWYDARCATSEIPRPRSPIPLSFVAAWAAWRYKVSPIYPWSVIKDRLGTFHGDWPSKVLLGRDGEIGCTTAEDLAEFTSIGRAGDTSIPVLIIRILSVSWRCAQQSIEYLATCMEQSEAINFLRMLLFVSSVASTHFSDEVARRDLCYLLRDLIGIQDAGKIPIYGGNFPLAACWPTKLPLPNSLTEPRV